MTALIRGSGGSSGGAVEASDTLRSVQSAEVVDLVSEGPIQGLVNGLKSVFVNGVPVENLDGTRNFEGVDFAWRLGTQGQSALHGFDLVQTELLVGVKCPKATPVVRSITAPLVDTVRVTLGFPQMSHQDDKGNLGPSEVAFAIDVQSNGGGFVEAYTKTLTGKTMSRFQHEVRLPLAGAGPWEVRLRRVSDDSANSSTQNEMWFDSLTEIRTVRQRYPNSAHFGLRVNAEHFRNIPTRSYDILGRVVQVPSNYDPITRVYTGTWDGTFVPAWTNNPAWIYYDLVTHRRYGLGLYIAPEHVDKWQLYQVGRYCDALVPDGRGGWEPRFSCGLYLNTAGEAYEVLRMLAAIFRAMVLWSNSQISVVQDAPSDPAHLFTRANVVDGKFFYQSTREKLRYSGCIVFWQNIQNQGKAEPELYQDPDLVRKYGVRNRTLTSVGIWSRGQAVRLAKWALYSEEYEGELVTFTVGSEGDLVRMGGVFQIADPSVAGERLGGRLKTATMSTVVLDAPVTLQPGEGYTLSVLLPDAGGAMQAQAEERVVVTGVGETATLNVTPPFSAVPPSGAVWVLQSTAVAATSWRCISIKPAKTASGTQFGITAVAHHPGKFALIEQGLKLEYKPISRLKNRVRPPTDLQLLETVYTDGTLNRSRITASWLPSAPGLRHTVKWRRDGEWWQTLGDTLEQTVDIGPLDAGFYEVQVRSTNALGTVSPAIQRPAEVLGGAPGIRSVRLSADALVFKVPVSGAATPDAITLTADVGGLSGASSWYVTGGLAVLTGTGHVRTLSYANLSAESVAITVSVVDRGQTFSDTLTIAKVRDGAGGADGLSGDQGIQGPPGTPGTPGAPGATTYFHVAFASNATGTAGFNQTAGDYIGTYVDTTPADSSNPALYTWRLFRGVQGPDGAQGIPGNNGANGQTTYLHIKYSNDGGATFTGSAGEEVGTWIGQYVDFVAADSNSVGAYTWARIRGADGLDGDQGIQGPPGTPGAPGATTYFHVAFASNGTGTAGFNQTAGDYIGTYVDTTPTDSSNPALYTWRLFRGVQGPDGAQGIPGNNGANGQTTYLHIKYSNDGGATFTGSAGEEVGTWMGVYVDFVVADSNSVGAYNWARIRGDAGTQGVPGESGSTSLINSGSWVAGAVGGAGFTPISGSPEDALVYADGPDGSQRLVWRATSVDAETSGSHGDGGWHTSAFDIAHRGTYRFGVWIRPSGVMDGSYYLGAGGNSVTEIGSSAPNDNPYFVAGPRAGLTAGRWYLAVGYVYGSDYSGAQPALSGLYDGATGERVAAGTDWKWVAGQSQSLHRAYQYYASVGAIQEFWGPRVDLCDGLEPTLQQLLAVSVRRTPVADLTLAAISLPADATGAVTDYAGASTSMVVMLGGVVDTTNWSVTRVDSGVTSAVSGSTVSVISMAAGVDVGFIDITAVRSGFANITKRVSVTKARRGAVGAGAFSLVGRGQCQVVDGRNVVKVGGVDSWDSDAYSQESYVGGAYVSFSAMQTGGHLMVGLNSDPSANQSYDTIDFAWFAANDGNCYIYESGAGILGVGPYTASTVLAIVYDGVQLRYMKDGEVVRTITPGANLRLYLDSSIAAPGAAVRVLGFGPVGARGADGSNGANGANGTNGTNGANGTNGTNGTNGVNGADGSRGTVTLQSPIGGSSWSDAAANVAIAAAGYASPVSKDMVTLHNSAVSYSETRFFAGGAWQVMAAYFNGGMVVDGTLATRKMVVNPGQGASLWPDPNVQDPGAWAVAPWGAMPTQVTISDGVSGNKAWQGGVGGASARGLRRVAVTAGRHYRISAYVRRSADANGLLYLRFDPSGTEVSAYEDGHPYSSRWAQSNGNAEGIVPPTSWTRYSWWVVPAPGTQYVSPMVLLNYGGSAGVMQAQDIRIEEQIDDGLVVLGGIRADRLAVDNLSSVSANIGEVTAGVVRNATNTSFLNLNATGEQDFLSAGGGALRLTAAGQPYFTKTFIQNTWTGFSQIYRGSYWPPYESDLPVGASPTGVQLLIDTGWPAPVNDVELRCFVARGRITNAYQSNTELSPPYPATGELTMLVDARFSIVVRQPTYTSAPNEANNPYGPGNARIFIKVEVDAAWVQGDRNYFVTAIHWALGTNG